MSEKCNLGENVPENEKGKCCCNCKYQVEVDCPPSKTGSLCGGYGCTAIGPNKIVVFEHKHGLCWLHKFKNEE